MIWTQFDPSTIVRSTSVSQHQFATGDGVTKSFNLSNNLFNTFKSASVTQVRKTDWQGTQIQFSTPRTNDVLRSQQFDNASWGKIGSTTIYPNNMTAPDGTYTADQVAQSVAGDSIYQDVSASGTSSQTRSVFIKNVNSTNLQLVIFWFLGGTTQNVALAFDPSTGNLLSVGGAATLIGYSITPFPNGWYQLELSGTGKDANNTKVRMQLYDNSPAVASYYAWGASSAQQGNYIPTTTAPVTVTDFVLSGKVLTFNSAPASGAILDWTGSYDYYGNEWSPIP